MTSFNKNSIVLTKKTPISFSQYFITFVFISFFLQKVSHHSVELSQLICSVLDATKLSFPKK